MKIIINRHEVRGRVFTVVYDQGHYLAIEDKFLDENGCLKQQLCGPQMFASVSLAGCLEFVRNDVEIHHLVSEGMSLAEATCSVLNIPLTDELRAVFEAAERR